ncbi:MAG: sigma-E factor negative regulatory protein [Pseudomonadota bacterium]
MSEQLREALSAVVDGEASEFETRRVLDELGRDESLRTSFASYQLAGAALRGENIERVADMRERIWAALDASDSSEAADVPVAAQGLLAPVAEGHRSRWLGGIAAAALLAVLVTGGSLLTRPATDGEPGIAQIESPVDTARDATAPVQAAATVAFDDAADAIDYGPGFVPDPGLQEDLWRRNEGYYLHHVQQRGLNDANLFPMIKLVSYEQ